MYSSLLTEDTYKRADAIYKSIADEYNPFLKEFVTSGKIHDKNVLEEGKSYKSCQAAAMKIGIAATSSPGSKDVGKCIMDIAETMQEINMARDAWLQKFKNDIIYPMERRSEQDGKYVVGLRKKSQEEFKARTTETEKALNSLQKLKKRSISKPNSRKAEEKTNKAVERLLSAKAASEMVAHEMLNRAFSEERRRYCFFVEKQCDLVNAWVEYHRTAFEILQKNLEQWKAIGASHRDLLPGAVALIESSLPRRTNVTLDELDMNMGISHSQSRSINDLRDETEADYKPPKPATSINLKRNATTRIAGSPKEVDIYNRYRSPLINLREDTVASNSPGRMKEEVEENQLQILESNGTSRPNSRSSFRRSDTSHMSDSSQASSFAPTAKEEARRSLNDSGISVEDISHAEQRLHDTLKRDNNAQEQQDNYTDQSQKLDVKSPSHESDRSSIASKNSTEDPKEKVQTWYESLYDYTPEGSGSKLSLRRGDRISVYSGEERGGWLYGTNKRSNQRGWFPATYTSQKKLEQEEVSSPPFLLSMQEEETTPPPSPMRFDPNKVRGVAVPTLSTPTIRIDQSGKASQNPLIIGSFGQSPTSSSDSSPRSGDQKKMVAGRNVFQFAKDLENPFQEIHLRKTTK